MQRLAFSPSGDLLASASYDGTVKVWGPLEDQCLSIAGTRSANGRALFRTEGELENNLAVSPDCRCVAVRDAPERISIVDVSGQYREIGRIPVPAESTTAVSFRVGRSPLLLNVAQENGQVLVWNVTAGQVARDWSPSIPACDDLGDPSEPDRFFAILPDGRHLFAIDSQIATLFDIETPGTPRTFPSDGNSPPGLTFSADLKTVGIGMWGSPACLVDLFNRPRTTVPSAAGNHQWRTIGCVTID